MSKTKKSQKDSERKTVKRADNPQNNSDHQGTGQNQGNWFTNLLSTITNHLSANKLIYELLCSLITAAATAVLAIITFQSLSMVTDQQYLSYRQFVLANQPSVRAYPRVNNPIEFKDDKVIINWIVINKGGYVQKLSYRTMVMALTVSMENEKLHLKATKDKFVVREDAQDRLDRDEMSINYWATGGESGYGWVKDALENIALRTYIGFRVQYNIPPELTIDGVEMQDHRFIFYHWHPVLKRLGNVENKELKALHSALIEAGIIKKDDLTGDE